MDNVIFRHDPGFDAEDLVKQLGPRLVQTSGQNYAIAKHKDDPADCSDRTEYFDWHSDGLYHPQPPRFVLLHCLQVGSGEVKTELASVAELIAKISTRSLRTLIDLHSTYIGHGGCFAHPIFRNNEMLLASRGYISPRPDLPLADNPSNRDIATAMSELYGLLDENAHTYEWSAGTTLIFDQYRYLHRRNPDNSAIGGNARSSTIDKDRKLVRMWFN